MFITLFLLFVTTSVILGFLLSRQKDITLFSTWLATCLFFIPLCFLTIRSTPVAKENKIEEKTTIVKEDIQLPTISFYLENNNNIEEADFKSIWNNIYNLSRYSHGIDSSIHMKDNGYFVVFQSESEAINENDIKEFANIVFKDVNKKPKTCIAYFLEKE